MTRERLENATKKMDEINILEKFIKAFKEPYMNCIRASSFGANDKDRSQTMIISSDSELHNLILNHCNSELVRLKEEFRDL
jgi:hypothetical protein